MPRLLPLVFALVALVGCRTDQTFDVQGRIVGFGQDGRTVIVAHEDIPGFMDAMTMPFKTKDGERVPDSLSVGDAVAFRLVVGGTASFIEALHRIPDDAVARMPGEPLPEGGFAEASGASYVADFLSTSEGLSLNQAFIRIKDAKVRRKIVDLVNAVAGSEDEPT